MSTPRKDEKAGTWYFVTDLPPGPEGERRQAKRRGFATRKAAQEALDKLAVNAKEGVHVAPRRQTVRDFLINDWLPAKRADIEASTIDSYERNLRNHILPTLGGVQLQALDPSQLNKLYGELLESGRRKGTGGLSPRSVRYVAIIMGAALDDAVKWGRLVRNPVRLAKTPKGVKGPEMRTWSRETLGRFLDITRDDHQHTAWLFLATTACRRGEALGLRWQDVDLDAGTATLRQTVTALKHKAVVRVGTKTNSGRTIRLDGATVAALRSHRARQAAEKLAMGAGYVDRDLVFAGPGGEMVQPELFSKRFAHTLKRLDLPRIRLHDLRHTWATLALQAGVDVKVVSERLGHASPTITWNVYQHVSPAMATDAAERVAGLIFGGS